MRSHRRPDPRDVLAIIETFRKTFATWSERAAARSEQYEKVLKLARERLEREEQEWKENTRRHFRERRYLSEKPPPRPVIQLKDEATDQLRAREAEAEAQVRRLGTELVQVAAAWAQPASVLAEYLSQRYISPDDFGVGGDLHKSIWTDINRLERRANAGDPPLGLEDAGSLDPGNPRDVQRAAHKLDEWGIFFDAIGPLRKPRNEPPDSPAWKALDAEVAWRRDLRERVKPLLAVCFQAAKRWKIKKHDQLIEYGKTLERFDAVRSLLHTIVTRAEIEIASPAAQAARPKERGEVKAAPKPVKRSWTQQELDDAIRAFKAKRSSQYAELVKGVAAGKAGAIKDARRVYGRNAIAKELGVKSAAMVSKSPAWKAIAAELWLGSRRNKAPARVGFDIAAEQAASRQGDVVAAHVINAETVRLIKAQMSRREAEAMLHKLETGDMTDDQARELLHLLAEQKKDKHSKRIA